jgi:hypothetical protein
MVSLALPMLEKTSVLSFSRRHRPGSAAGEREGGLVRLHPSVDLAVVKLLEE